MRRVLDSRAIAACLFVAVLVPRAAAAESTPILAVVPQGAVIDATAFSDLAVGGTFSLRSSQDNSKELARGAVVDLRDGRALIAVSAGSAVKAGDVALRCATPASQTQLKASLEQIKAQVAAAPTPELQQILADLDTAVQSRDTAIASGTCDVSTLDQTLNDLGTRLQQAMAASSTATSAPAPSSPATGAQGAGADPSTGTTAGQPDTKTGADSGGTTGADSLDSIVQAVGKLFKMFQSLGSGSGDASSRGSSDASVPASGVASSDPSTATPAPPSAPFAPTPAPPVDAPSAPTPPPTGTIGTAPVTPPAPAAPPTPVTPVTPTTPTRPPRIVVSPAPAAPVRPPVAAPPSSAPATPAPPGGTSPTAPWWTVVRPRPTPTTGGDPGAAAGGVQLKPLPTLGGGAPPSGPLRPVGPIAAVKPGVVHGRVLGDVDGRPGLEPVRGASVSISDGPRGTADRRAVTNDGGGFTFAGLAAGRYSVVVTAPGFRPATVGVSVAGDDVPLNLTLQRQVAPPALRPRTVPSHGLPPTHTRPESP